MISLDNQIAKKIIKKIMNDTDYKININIMNEYGEIIASGDKYRIGKIHSGALEVIEKRKSMHYFDTIDNDTESSKPGINMPIIFNNEVIEVVGVTGNPKKINIIADMVKMLTEIFIEREIDADKKIFKQTTLNNYIHKIISKENYNYASTINIWAEKNNYLFDIDRAVCLIKFEKNENLDIYKTVEYIIDKTKYLKYFYKQDIVSYLGNRQFIIIKSFNNKEKTDKKSVLKNFFTSLQKEIDSKMNLKFSTACGVIVNSLDNIPYSYEHADFLLNYIECKNKSVYFIEDYILEFLTLSEEANSKMILGNALNIIKRSPLYKETITAMSKNDMNINKACESLQIHRNTMVYRMKKIKKILGLDPINNHKDRIKFYILSIILNKKN